jgi:ABC-type phosphate transport system substrate-binding protein
MLIPLFTTISWLTPTATGAEKSALTIWVNTENKSNGLSFADVKSIFRGDIQTWDNGDRIILFIPPKGTRSRTGMLLSIYSMTEGRFQQYWLAKTYQHDVSSPPKEVAKPSILGVLLQNTPGGITIVDHRTELTGGKKIPVDGLLANENGYPLVY